MVVAPSLRRAGYRAERLQARVFDRQIRKLNRLAG
jgi:hypothetical protein